MHRNNNPGLIEGLKQLQQTLNDALDTKLLCKQKLARYKHSNKTEWEQNMHGKPYYQHVSAFYRLKAKVGRGGNQPWTRHVFTHTDEFTVPTWLSMLQ